MIWVSSITFDAFTEDKVQGLWGRARRACSQHGQVVAGFGLLFERHFLVVFGDDFPQEPLGFLANALPPLAARHSPRVVLFAVLAQSDLAHDALEEILDIVVERGRGLDELAVEYDGAGSAL